MISSTHIADVFTRTGTLLEALFAVEPNRFLAQFRAAKTTDELYDAALALGYAAGSKEIRDTCDAQVHILAGQILLELEKLDALFRVNLYPSSAGQKLSWEVAVARDSAATYAFRKDGSIQISLLDSTLSGSTLHVKRIWTHVCSFDGSRTNFSIKLEADQIVQVKDMSAAVRAFRRAFSGDLSRHSSKGTAC